MSHNGLPRRGPICEDVGGLGKDLEGGGGMFKDSLEELFGMAWQ